MCNVLSLIRICREIVQNSYKSVESITLHFVHDYSALCLICNIFSASYAIYSVLHTWSTQCFICDMFNDLYMIYSVLHMQSTQCFICNLLSASYVIYSVLKSTRKSTKKSTRKSMRKSMNKLIVKLSFHIYILTWLNYSISIFWFNSITWYQFSDST